MNRGQLNGFALNGQVSDPVVRVRVDAKGYAVGRASGRVLAYGVVDAKPCAKQIGIQGRVEAHLSVQARALSAVSGVLGRVDIRGLLQATGRARIEVTLPPVYGRVRIKGVARIGVAAHVRARIPVQSIARVDAKVKSRLLRRGPLVSKPTADIAADGRIFIRRWLRSPVDSTATSFIVSNARIEARLAALVHAQALVVVSARAMRRTPVWARGVALIEINAEVHKRLPFDEQAPEYRTFIVPAGQSTFYVTE